MKFMVVAAALAVGGVALAQQDPLEMTVNQQVTAQAPGAQMVAPFFKGAAPKTDYQVLLEAGKCYWWSGAAGGTVKKLALYLWGPDGKRITDAKSGGPLTTMAFCPSVSGMHKFQAKIEGSGFYTVGLYAKEAPRQAAAPPPPPVAQPAAPDLGPICDRAAGSAAPGARRLADFFEGAGGSIGHSDRQDYTVQMDQGKCYTIVSCGQPDGIKAISLYLWGPNNKRVTESKADSPTAMIGHCPAMTGMYKVQSKITKGSGSYKVGVYVK
jgi:hypothetical protein